MDQEEQDVEIQVGQDEAEKDVPPHDTPRIEVGLTPFGKIGVNIYDPVQDVQVGYVIQSPGEAWELAGHINAIATMMVQAFYAQAAAEQQMMQKIMQENGGGKLWTPNE